MSLFAVISSHGSENPTQAALPLVIANGAHEAGHTAEVILMGDAVVIAKQVVRDAVFPVGWPPLKEMYATALKNGVKVHVWGACSAARGVTEADLKTIGASFTNPKSLAALVARADRTVSF